MADLFDMELRARRRDRAFRNGPELFLYERAFADCLDRLGIVQRPFRTALLIGCPDPGWAERLREFAETVDVFDPGEAFAKAAGGETIVEDRFDAGIGRYELCLAIGTLDTVNDLPQALLRIRASLTADAFFLGALSGGDTMPELRAAMRAADQADGVAVPHVHPRIEAAALAGLLSAAGFANPVVDVDRVRASYEQLTGLVADLRAMGATNVLTQRSRRPLSKRAWEAARAAFAAAAAHGRTTETFEILHFAGWTRDQG
jgi:NADH dehydrogenase [ubiquinone] 1 alpha subcomplex assembly factor 5